MPERTDTLHDTRPGHSDLASGPGPRWTYMSTGTDPHAYECARRRLDQGETIRFTCPQKVCLSGDYGDMDPNGGVTLTAAVDIRPALTVRKAAGRSRFTVSGRPVNLHEWDLFRAFADDIPRGYRVDITPTKFTNLGLGSSGAASVNFAMAAAVLRGESYSTDDLISAAHVFETKMAFHDCGPQDHAASVLGGLNVIHFPGLVAESVENLDLWPNLSFWVSDERRDAHIVIPKVVDAHNQSKGIWARKRAVTLGLRDALADGDIAAAIEVMREEAGIQRALGMLTEQHDHAVAAVTGLGGAAKVSGAGCGGVLVVAAPVRPRDEIDETLRNLGHRLISLHVDRRGPLMECAVDRPEQR